MGQRDAAVLGKGTASCAVPCSILPSSTQDQHCREWRCCGGMQSETKHSAPQSATVSELCLCFFKLQVPSASVLHISGCGCVPLPLPVLGFGTWLCTAGSMPWDHAGVPRCHLKCHGGWGMRSLGEICGWGCVGNKLTLLMPGQGYPWVGKAR